MARQGSVEAASPEPAAPNGDGVEAGDSAQKSQGTPAAKANPWVALLRSKFPQAAGAPPAPSAPAPAAAASGTASQGPSAGFDGLMERLNGKIDSVLKAQEQFSNFEDTVKTMKNDITEL